MIDLDSGNGLFDACGKWKYLLDLINTHIGNESSGWPKELNDALVIYDGASNALRNTVTEMLSALAGGQRGVSSFKQAIRTAAQQTLITMANADDPLPEQTVPAALTVLVQQMLDAAQTVDASEPTISTLVRGDRSGVITAATAANPVEITSNGHGLTTGERISIFDVAGMVELNGLEFTVDVQDANTFELVGINGSGYTTYTSGGIWKANHGSGVLRVSLRDGRGRLLENVLAEDIVATCTDSTSEGAEQFQFLGEEAITDKLDHRWPAGSGANLTRSVTNAGSSLLSNGDLETFTVTDTPDDWTLTGTPTTDVFEENTNFLRGTSALEFNSDGATLYGITQAVTGLQSRTPYAVNLWSMVDVQPAAGVLTVDLYDGANVIVDDEGNANSFTVDLTAHGAYFEAHGGFFRLPEPVPDTVIFRVRVTTAISNTTSLFLDELTLIAADRLVEGTGPYAKLFAGASDFGIDDEFLISIVNALAGALQNMANVFWDTAEAEVLLPSATGSAETIADSLIG